MIAYGFLIFVGIVLLVLPVSVPIIKTSAEFSMFNTKWNGCSKFAELLYERGDVVPILYPYNSVNLGNLKGTLVIVGPDVDFSRLEAKEVRDFLNNGGVVFIADDFGSANTLLKELGVKVRFSKLELKDVFYDKSVELPVVVRVKGFDVDKIVLNVPSVVIGGKGEAFTSKVSIVGKRMGSYPILAEVKYGNGKIVLLSDPSILINDMIDKNGRFVEELVDYINTGRFYYDEAHHSDFNPYEVSTVYIHKELDRGKAFMVFVAVSLIALFVESGFARNVFNYMLSKLPRREENLLDDLPEWVDRDKLMKMLDEIKRGSKLGDLNERKRVDRKG